MREDICNVAERKRLQTVLDQLNPAGGKTEADRPGKAKAKQKARKKKTLE